MAPRRDARGRPGDRAGALRRRSGLLATLPAPPGRRLVLRRADDRASRRARPPRARRRRSSTPIRRSRTAHIPQSRSKPGTTTPRRRVSFPCAPGIPSRFCTSRSGRSPRSSARASTAGGSATPTHGTSRPCTRSCSRRRSATAGSVPSTMATRSTTRRSPADSRTARSRSTPAFATCCVRCATRTGASSCPATGHHSRSPGRAPSRTRQYAAEASVLVEIDGIVRAEQRVRALEREARARSSEARSGQLVDWRGDDAGHDAARARRDRHRRLLARLPSERRRRLRDRDRQPFAGRDDGGARGVRALGPGPPDPGARRGPAPGRVGDADGAPRGHRLRGRLGDQLRCGRVLVAAGGVALRGARGGAAAVRDGRRVPPRVLPETRRRGRSPTG